MSGNYLPTIDIDALHLLNDARQVSLFHDLVISNRADKQAMQIEVCHLYDFPGSSRCLSAAEMDGNPPTYHDVRLLVGLLVNWRSRSRASQWPFPSPLATSPLNPSPLEMK